MEDHTYYSLHFDVFDNALEYLELANMFHAPNANNTFDEFVLKPNSSGWTVYCPKARLDVRTDMKPMTLEGLRSHFGLYEVGDSVSHSPDEDWLLMDWYREELQDFGGDVDAMEDYYTGPYGH